MGNGVFVGGSLGEFLQRGQACTDESGGEEAPGVCPSGGQGPRFRARAAQQADRPWSAGT
eukprot:310242-Alexandrium_andersonii.AAC.1